MTAVVEPRERLKVVITDPLRPPRVYRRPFVGLTVARAVELLEKEDDNDPDFPCVHGDEWFLNGERIPRDSERVLQKEDVLKTKDPPKNH